VPSERGHAGLQRQELDRACELEQARDGAGEGGTVMNESDGDALTRARWVVEVDAAANATSIGTRSRL